jgi:hydroxymethylpyrimidine pyrophosphatase-like HAD family hydrolase
MAGFVRAVALDLDGTLTRNELVSEVAIGEVDRLRADGLVAVLVTGRIARELDEAFPGLRGHFDAVVAENGAVLLIGETATDLAEPVDVVLADALAELGIGFRRGRVLLAGDAADAEAVVSTIGMLDLDYQVVRNRGALMVLPAGTSKGTGLLVVLDKLAISPHNVVAVGDAQNDLSLLHVAEVGVAVANSVPALRKRADLVLDETDGAGVAALLAGEIVAGEQVIQPARRRVTLGRFDDGTPATVAAWPANFLVCGETGTGKSYIAGLLIEEWIMAGYTVLVIDMEGDHVGLDRLRNTVVLDGRPPVSELLSMLRQPSLSVVLDVSALGPGERLDYLRTLPEAIEAQRAAWGLPHWIVVDEAQATLLEGGIVAEVFRPTDRGYCLVTYHPEQLCADATAAIDVTITAARPSNATLERAAQPPHAATVRETGLPERTLSVDTRRTPHVRHRHKYAIVSLPEHRWFRFRRPDGTVVADAANIADFNRILRDIDTSVLEHHLRRGDFSRWLLGSVQDKDLASSIGAIERTVIARHAANLFRAHERILEEVGTRYALEGITEARTDQQLKTHDRGILLARRLERAAARSEELSAQTMAVAAQYRQAQPRRKASSSQKHEARPAGGDDEQAVGDRLLEQRGDRA